MKKILLFALMSAVLLGEDTPMYDDAYTAKTKEAIMLSQLLPKGDSLKIDISGTFSGKRGFLSSFSDNNDEKWIGKTDLMVNVDTCYSEDAATEITKKGYILKSRIADSTVVGYREAVKLLKDNGAKYIFVLTSLKNRGVVDPLASWKGSEPLSFERLQEIHKTDKLYTPAQLQDLYDISMREWKASKPKDITVVERDDAPNNIQYNRPFSEFFQEQLMDKTFEKRTDRFLPEGCFRDRSLKASDFFWLAGQVAALAIGAKGASVGNTNMTSLAANTSHAVNNTEVLMQNSKNNDVNSKQIAFIALKTKINILGIIDQKYFEKNYYFGDVKISAHVFPISEVEEHLSHYKVIPYNVKKITSN
jgi:hypothetical protein